MKCPVCASPKSKVLDTRPVEENNSIRRIRECELFDKTSFFQVCSKLVRSVMLTQKLWLMR